MASQGGVVLSYHNTLLRESDVSLLNDEEWLNDNLIAFWCEYLEHDLYKQYASSATFVSPQVCHFIKLSTPTDVREMFYQSNFDKKKFILFPINDCEEHYSPGGSHWSLLAFIRKYNTFQHYDSQSGSRNSFHAKNVAKIISPLVNPGATKPEVQEMKCIQQSNGYDCGIHVICNAEAVCRKEFTKDPKPISDIASPDVIQRTRRELKNLIYNMNKSK